MDGEGTIGVIGGILSGLAIGLFVGACMPEEKKPKVFKDIKKDIEDKILVRVKEEETAE